jgi:hypothetical protein
MTTRDPSDIPTDDPRPDDLKRRPRSSWSIRATVKGKTSAAIGVVVRRRRSRLARRRRAIPQVGHLAYRRGKGLP